MGLNDMGLCQPNRYVESLILNPNPVPRAPISSTKEFYILCVGIREGLHLLRSSCEKTMYH